MSFSLRFSSKAEKHLSKMDASQSRIIVAWLLKNIEGCSDPRAFGKALTADHEGKWLYRVGTCRVLVDISDDELIVLAIEVGH